MSEVEIKFINHACYMIEDDKEAVIFDPWFEGKVFNDSWSLLRETHEINYNKIKFIIITHEHPDHLHWPTLKKILSSSNNTVNVLIPQRKNKNVINNLRKIGFKCAEIPPNQEFKINHFLSIANYPTGHDTAYIFKIGDKVYLNQNDCQLSQDQCFLIKNKYPKIDYWFMQFSLAGYYANKDDYDGLTKAKCFHKEMIKNYFSIFKPSVVIPFASFIYFCKEHNSFLNDWVITIDEIVNELQDLPWQILFYDDKILDNQYEERNSINIQKWQQIFNDDKQILKHQSKSKEEIMVEAKKLILLAKQRSTHQPEEVYFSFYDKHECFKLDLRREVAEFVDTHTPPVEKHAGLLHSEDFLFFLKFPWGADTLNITSCFEVKQPNLWRNILIFKDQLYER
tara:strand:+ start:3325 stop:4512 length:1188 start_codon:yes stop_codon:yes gene_type:complete